ncbi:conserved hypothetical protein [Perkinsus marinus ATCC 50983]|uniref:Uncharacterized protein n=1 Tax=Perkinsus marinus (strain ATCC 50983 / TXsc) TaxID=423536 RepID=C5LK80_PERM5|nr:conserved hypothetical protein [Perkinsus marinus ATCC 50983]EER02867.1 conserved hypothetical protein [Perkinsus marinus ATCC 50983]|eukprot:XP_002771051.1 conserved hypothetical protein [Perkinsus marinus ATCC 50983]
MFAARKVSRSHRRKRPTEDEVDVEDSSTGESLSLDDLKEMQRERSRTKGVAADRHAEAEVEEVESQPEEKDEEEWGLLKRTFQDTGARLGTEQEVDKHMQQWVNQKLVAMGHHVVVEGGDGEAKGPHEDAAGPVSRVAKVFGTIPDRLQHESTTEKRLMEEADSNWSLGLVEVETDRLEELRAIERAEDAKMRFLEEASRKGSAVGGQSVGVAVRGKDRAKAAADVAMSEIIKRQRTQ